MKKPTVALLVLGAIALALGCGDDDRPKGAFAPVPEREKEEPKAPPPADPATPPGTEPVAILETTQGEIVLRFFPDKAPRHVENFLAHVKSGLYEGTYFHRVSPTFMIQGGDPNTKDQDPDNDGQGGYSWKGPGTTVKAELSGVHHVRGILSAARGQDKDSAGSQFFIMVAENAGLDGQYSAFGEVVKGMDVADRIAAQPGVEGGDGTRQPREHQYIEKARIEYWPKERVEELKAGRR